ncbi:hypothetical protein AB5J49_00450 [Streptomyces sp. R28]|uniref:Uncharacterized protein n=1 Tax=Streptomyces sp. R28 TaxID=3238628 RepID=A0AB39PQ80_9ACTN
MKRVGGRMRLPHAMTRHGILMLLVPVMRARRRRPTGRRSAISPARSRLRRAGRLPARVRDHTGGMRHAQGVGTDVPHMPVAHAYARPDLFA